jgi:hypothetical protein
MNLRGFNSPRRYRVLFEYPWMPHPPSRGFFLEDGGSVVGYLGAVYSDRVIGGHFRRFCNLTAWCVLPPYRSQSLDLLFAVTRDPDQTIVNLTPNPNVQRILQALRYQVLDSFKLFTVPGAHWWTLLHRGRLQVFTDLDNVLSRLDEAGRRILRDHDSSGCRHTLIRGREGDCHVISNRRVKKGIPFSEILYVGNPGMLRRHFERVKLNILRLDKTLLLAIDERLIGNRLPFTYPFPRISMFRSRDVKRTDIDNLYSELVW